MISIRKGIQGIIGLLIVSPIPFAISSEDVDSVGNMNCFELNESIDQVTKENKGNSAIQVGDCFFESAEALISYFNEYDATHSSNRSDIIAALEYADSWYTLASFNKHQDAETKLNQTRMYLKKFSLSKF